MSRSIVIFGMALALLGSGFALARVRAEQSTTPQESSALLNEVRLLRRAIEALAGNGARVQIVFGRLQLQEQRTTAAVRRLDEARAALAKMTTTIGGMTDRAKELEDAIAEGRRADEELKALQQELQMLKRESAALEAERARLAAGESEAAALLAQEQGHWSDLNRQLEELERALMPRPQ